ncbi:MAG TPA: nucleotidyltransferase domain-containing protein [Atribacteraceae bacterium]|nr:nucleotidyltransferase domain-containing protein [Atribacteraceae bacterium]
MHNEIQKVLDEVKHRIVSRFQPQRIILFGSYAGDKPGPDSDLDILVVMEVKGSTRQKANEIDLLMADRIVPMDFIVLTPEQYEQQKNIIGTMVRQADREGKVIYERAA